MNLLRFPSPHARGEGRRTVKAWNQTQGELWFARMLDRLASDISQEIELDRIEGWPEAVSRPAHANMEGRGA